MPDLIDRIYFGICEGADRGIDVFESDAGSDTREEELSLQLSILSEKLFCTFEGCPGLKFCSMIAQNIKNLAQRENQPLSLRLNLIFDNVTYPSSGWPVWRYQP